MTGSTAGSPRLRYGWIILFAGLLIHIVLVISILRQPLAVNLAPRSERSITWPLFNDSVHRIGPGADFFAVYHAGHALVQESSLYSLQESPRRTPYFYPFRYLPVVAQTIGKAAAPLEPIVAYRLWIGLIEVVLAVTLVVLFRTMKRFSLFLFSSLLLMLNAPYLLELQMGQFTFVASALFCLSLLLGERRPARGVPVLSWVAPTLLYAGSVLLKLIPLLGLPASTRHRRFWIPIGVAVALVMMTNLPYFATHPGEWDQFRRVNIVSPIGGADAGNFSLFHLIDLVLVDHFSDLLARAWIRLAPVVYLLTLGLTTAFVLAHRRSVSLTVGAATMILSHFVSYSQLWEHHISGVIPVGLLLLLAATRSDGGRPRTGTFVAVIVALILCALPTPFLFLDRAKEVSLWDPSLDWSPIARYALVLSKAVPVLLLYGISLRLCRTGSPLPHG